MSTSTLPSIPGTDPERSPLDAFKIAVAASINKALPEVPLEAAYKAADIGRKGVDFSVAVARFKLGGKPDPWAKKVEESVSPAVSLTNVYLPRLTFR